jgi:hypothetical protein
LFLFAGSTKRKGIILAMPTREELHQLVSSLPDDALFAAQMALTQMQVWPPPELARLEEQSKRVEERMKQRIERLRQDHPYSGGGGGGMFMGGSGAQWRGRDSSSYDDDNESVHESAIVHDDCEFTLVERIRRDQVGGTVTFVIELTGPDGTTVRHEHRFEVT